MQIDFHHAVTYVAARLAGFPVKEADIISYSAQYVDDAVNPGTVRFRNKAMYYRISSAHKMLDYRNFEELANHFTWVPFHFLPGNGGKEAGKNPEGGFVEKLVCFPDSQVAHDMVTSAIACSDMEYGLHRLGITAHVLADTFAHQKFAGINHEINEVNNLEKTENEHPAGLLDKVKDYFGDFFDAAANKLVSNVSPLGHGGALTCPDMPFLKWRYDNGLGTAVERDNTQIFKDAVKSIHKTMVCYRMNNPEYEMTSNDEIPANDLERIEQNFSDFTEEEGEDRHIRWQESIANGDFSFAQKGEENISYIPKGVGSWKYIALDTKKEMETGIELYKFSSEFMSSNWKLFHDALQIHRIDIIRNILPKYGICAA